MLNEMRKWAEEAKNLFPQDAQNSGGKNYHEKIDSDLAKFQEKYRSEAHKFTADRVIANKFRSIMNTNARVAYRKGFQSEIVEI